MESLKDLYWRALELVWGREAVRRARAAERNGVRTTPSGAQYTEVLDVIMNDRVRDDMKALDVPLEMSRRRGDTAGAR